MRADPVAEALDLHRRGKLHTPEAPFEEIEPAADEAPTFLPLSELLLRPELLEPPEEVVPYLGHRGRCVILAAPPKAGKSTLAAHAAAAKSRGRRWLDRAVEPGGVISVGLEEALGDAVRRLGELDADPDMVQVATLAPPDLLTQLDELLAEWPAEFVVIDCLTEWARVTGGVPDDGDNAGWSGVVRPLTALARKHDVALLILHHARRSDGEARGAGEIMAAVDATLDLVMPSKEGDPATRTLRGRGRWQIDTVTVALRDGQYVLDDGAQLSLDTRILLYVEQHPGCSQRDIREQVTGKAQAIATGIRGLVNRGALEDRSTDDRMKLYAPTSEVA